MYIIYNGKIVTEEKIIEDHAVLVNGPFIEAIIPEGDIYWYIDAQFIDAKGGYISPGFVDIHSDYIETIVSPRPTSMMNVDISLREAEKILISHGITTMFHSLSFYREDVFSNKPIRQPRNVQRLVDAIAETHHALHLIRHRMPARCESDNIDGVEQIVKNIEEDKVHLLSFMDHTPGQGQYRDLEIYRDTLKGYRDLSNEQIADIIKERKNSKCLTIDQIKEVANLALSKNIAVASHDDDDTKKLNLVKTLGTTISEFPITMGVAKKAKEMGLVT